MNLDNISTEDLKKELQKRSCSPGIWSVIKYIRNDNEYNYYKAPQHIHLIEKDGIQIECQLVDKIYNQDLNENQPTTSDEDPNWDSDWQAYEEYSIQYFIGKKVKIDSFDPIKISQII